MGFASLYPLLTATEMTSYALHFLAELREAPGLAPCGRSNGEGHSRLDATFLGSFGRLFCDRDEMEVNYTSCILQRLARKSTESLLSWSHPCIESHWSIYIIYVSYAEVPELWASFQVNHCPHIELLGRDAESRFSQSIISQGRIPWSPGLAAREACFGLCIHRK